MAQKKKNDQKKSTQEEKPRREPIYKRIFLWFKEKSIRWIAALVIIILAFIIIYNSNRSQQNAQEAYQTVEATRGDLIAIVGGTGIVEANQTVDLAWQTTGRVDSVNVKVTDKVKKGDILADLADNTLPQSVILAQADLVTAKKDLEDLINSNTESAEAYAKVVDLEQELRDAEDDRDYWNYKGTSITRVNNARQEFIDADEEFKIYESAYDALSSLPADDPKRVEAKEKYNEYKLIRDKALRALNYLLGKGYGHQVAEDFAHYDVVKAQMDDAQREWDRVKNGPNADDINAAEAKVAAAEATVSLGWIEAPFDGVVTLAYPKAGDEIETGTAAFRMDDLSRLFVNVDISEVDINRVKVGQRADLTFDAINGITYSGEVTEVAAVGYDSGSGVDFTVTLEITDADKQVKPGMTAAVNIIVSEVTDVLTVPNRAVRLKDNHRIVYVLRDGKLQEIEIEIGSASDTNVEVVSGDLKEGDQIVLNPPFEFTANGGQSFGR